jgi:hypothetical protein
MNHIGLFSGIGGFELAAQQAEDVLNWWTSGISRKKYMANKLQLTIKL